MSFFESEFSYRKREIFVFGQILEITIGTALLVTFGMSITRHTAIVLRDCRCR